MKLKIAVLMLCGRQAGGYMDMRYVRIIPGEGEMRPRYILEGLSLPREGRELPEAQFRPDMVRGFTDPEMLPLPVHIMH